jgi:hypothetical protein
MGIKRLINDIHETYSSVIFEYYSQVYNIILGILIKRASNMDGMSHCGEESLWRARAGLTTWA